MEQGALSAIREVENVKVIFLVDYWLDILLELKYMSQETLLNIYIYIYIYM